jgi:hypothetical protein
MEGVKINNGEGYICKDVGCFQPPCGVVPASCGDINNKSQCEQKETVIKDGNALECVWIIDRSNVGLCVAKHESSECQYYTSEVGCTWTISGVLCVWSGKGCGVIESCSDISEIDKCDGYSSIQGKCFLNGKVCRNVEKIDYCDQLLTLSLCSDATTDIYFNLHDDGINQYPCKWDPTVQLCQTRVAENEKDIPAENDSNTVTIIVIIIVVVVVVVVILSVIVVIMILLRWKTKNKDSQLSDSVKSKEFEMKPLKPNSPSSNQNKGRKTGFNYEMNYMNYFL